MSGEPTDFGPGESELSKLKSVDDDAILVNTQDRYNAGHIYTRSGRLLLAVNPYRQLPLYTAEVLTAYKLSLQPQAELPPHVFAVAASAHLIPCLLHAKAVQGFPSSLDDERANQGLCERARQAAMMYAALFAVAVTTPLRLGLTPARARATHASIRSSDLEAQYAQAWQHELEWRRRQPNSTGVLSVAASQRVIQLLSRRARGAPVRWGNRLLLIAKRVRNAPERWSTRVRQLWPPGAADAARSSPPLPPGWLQYTCPTTRRPYFCSFDGTTTWNRPDPDAFASPIVPLPSVQQPSHQQLRPIQGPKLRAVRARASAMSPSSASLRVAERHQPAPSAAWLEMCQLQRSKATRPSAKSKTLVASATVPLNFSYSWQAEQLYRFRPPRRPDAE